MARARKIEAPFYITMHGSLYSRAHYRTKLSISDLPDDYMIATIGSSVTMAVRGSGVAGLHYLPNLTEPSMFQHDALYVTHKNNKAGAPDVKLNGNIIPIFLLYAEHYSDYDIVPICEQIENKRMWFLNAFPFEYEKEVGSYGSIMDFYRKLYADKLEG